MSACDCYWVPHNLTLYTPHVDIAFISVEHIMRDVSGGWLLRYMHANGASMFFIVVYIHMFRGLYYGSYASPREALWCIGVVILLLMIATAFIGYVLPWGPQAGSRAAQALFYSNVKKENLTIYGKFL